MQRRKGIIVSLLGAAVLSGLLAAWPHIEFYSLTGRFSPIHKIESLKNPVAVKGWSADGLLLAGGRTVQLPGLRHLPKGSIALTEAISRGVEITPDGRVFGLMKIHHWCGNDPVREHIARVDISDLMMFLHVGETIGPIPEADLTIHENADRFSEWGWNVSDFFRFQNWEIAKSLDDAPIN